MPPVLFCTDAPNDRDLVQALGSRAMAIPIPHGDVVFFAVTDDGDATTPPRVCVERKRIVDMTSCIFSGRYLHQAQGAYEAGFRLVLVVEGEYRADSKTGLLCVPVLRSGMTAKSLKPRIRRVFEPIEPNITYSRFCQYLIEVSLFAGVLVLRSQNVTETADIIKALWVNFQTPPSEHQSLKVFYQPPSQHPLLIKPGLVRRVSKEFDGIGWERSKDVAQRFSSVREMANAEVTDWLEVPGIGKKIAENVVRQITGGENGSE